MRFAEVSSSLESDRCGVEADAHASTGTDCKQKGQRQDEERLTQGNERQSSERVKMLLPSHLCCGKLCIIIHKVQCSTTFNPISISATVMLNVTGANSAEEGIIFHILCAFLTKDEDVCIEPLKSSLHSHVRAHFHALVAVMGEIISHTLTQ